ncbi:hypothetical protein D3C76_1461930 [compost metagenome]
MRASGGQAVLLCRLLRFHFFSDFCIYRSTDLVNAEAGRALARWVIDEGLQELRRPHGRVCGQVNVFGQPVVVLVGNHVGAFVRVHAQVEDFRYPQAY